MLYVTFLARPEKFFANPPLELFFTETVLLGTMSSFSVQLLESQARSPKEVAELPCFRVLGSPVWSKAVELFERMIATGNGQAALELEVIVGSGLTRCFDDQLMVPKRIITEIIERLLGFSTEQFMEEMSGIAKATLATSMEHLDVDPCRIALALNTLAGVQTDAEVVPAGTCQSLGLSIDPLSVC